MRMSRIKSQALRLISDDKKFYAFLFIIIAIQICSLNFFMPPWFDEVVFADISYSLSTHHNFLLNIHPLSTDNSEVFMFGPVFFYIQAFVISHIAFSAFFFRLSVYAFGVLAAFILGRVLFIITAKKSFERIFLLLFFTNFLICGSLSCGRMEMPALFFISLSLLFFLRKYERKRRNNILIHILASGIMFSMAILTTPRSSFLYLLYMAPLIKIFTEGVHTREIKLIIIPFMHIFLSFGIPYLAWYFPHFGNPFEIFNFIAPAAKTQISFVDNHIDINSFLWLLIDVFLLAFAVLKKIKMPGYLYGFLFNCIVFISVVIPWSYHHGMVVPVLILTGLIIVFFIQQTFFRNFVSYLFALVFGIQLCFITIKYIITWIDIPSRNSIALQKIIRQNIPEKSKVIGSYNYYYACINDNCEFKSIEDNTRIATGKPVPVVEKIDYLINTYKGEYIVAYNSEKDELQSFLETGKFTKIATITIPDGYETFWEKCRRILKMPGYTFYNGSIYKRIKNNKQ
jgi:hypothetical protein